MKNAPLLSITEVAELLSVCRPTVYRLVRDGSLTATRIGHQYRFEPQAIESLIERGREPVTEQEVEAA